MLIKESDTDIQDLSTRRCSARFGYYGHFATLMLKTAVVKDGVYTLQAFKQSLKWSVSNPLSSADLAEYIRNLDFPDSEFFTLDEIRFLINVSECCLSLTEQQIEADRRELKQESRKHGKIIKSHAIILLKALSYWELRYNEKYEEWMEIVNVVYNDRHAIYRGRGVSWPWYCSR